MPPLFATPAFRPFFLQAAEAAKLAAQAGQNATSAVAKGGESAAIAWFLFLLSLIALVILATLHWKELQGKAQEVQKAGAAIREECAREMATNIGHEQDSKSQMREQYEKEIARLREDNKEKERQILENNKDLRQQESKSAEVLLATANSLRAIAKTTNANNANSTELLRGLAVIYPQAGIRPGITPDIL